MNSCKKPVPADDTDGDERWISIVTGYCLFRAVLIKKMIPAQTIRLRNTEEGRRGAFSGRLDCASFTTHGRLE